MKAKGEISQWWHDGEFIRLAAGMGISRGQARLAYLVLLGALGGRNGLCLLGELARSLGMDKGKLLGFARALALYEHGYAGGEKEDAGKTRGKKKGEQLLTTKELAPILKLSVPTLHAWRCVGKGPAYVKLGGKVLYRQADVDKWLEASRVCPAWPAV